MHPSRRRGWPWLFLLLALALAWALPGAPAGAAQVGAAWSSAANATSKNRAQALDKALLDARVTYLTGSAVTDVLRDSAGQVAGVVMANRSGRQAVLGKVLIDATERGAVARLAGATFTA